ncbi:HlyC/CorC family transporter [[Clostridium] polysaccharolyticum]|uniref:Hemolysin, contains CBS domains n=1 Tax=[Clostridium] polysaccharolyticum TaxID=29364 RepID=A0A1H9YQA8_9FIRM|nr:hemolysin family protein [[Clostridium] polysaccharolyticum]SES71281.1 Hemolysin, contains CBS domains [[Clostridium] polysaccharolyticum]
MDPSDVTQLIILFVLLILSAFFSSAETALTTVNKIRIRNLADENVKGAKTVSKLIEDPTKLLSAILIGNNIVNLSASSLATTLTVNICKSSGVSDSATVGAGIATFVLTVLVLIFGEITPKSLATIHAEKISLAYGGIIYFITQLLTPVIFIINKLAYGLLKLLQVDPHYKGLTITETELRTIVDVSHEEGVLESEERKMITNVVDFGDALAKDVMVPRIDMVFVDINLSYDELVEAFSKDKFSRMPVFDGARDNVAGIINLKDVFFYQGSKEDFHIKQLLREPYFTYEFKKTSELLIEMRKASRSIAIVLDEYGATAGLITLEDLLEEIVGEIRDEYDGDEEDSIIQISPSEFIADGFTKLDEVNEIIGSDLESDDYDSIAGHIISLLEHLPVEGESIIDNHIQYTVQSVEKNRIDKIHILLLPKEENMENE